MRLRFARSSPSEYEGLQSRIGFEAGSRHRRSPGGFARLDTVVPASLARNGWHFEIETDDDSTGGHFLYLHHGAPPKPFHVRAMHASLNLRAGHEFYKTIMRDGGTYNMIERMQTRTKLHATIGLHDYEAFDASIVRIILPEAMPQF